jgi:ribosomal protein L11 methyltransferase
MRYYSSTFHIECSDANLLQAARELLADALGEGGYEAFEDTPDGIIGYVQEDNYDESAVKEAIATFPLGDVTITYSTESVPDQNWNAAWEEEGFEPIEVKKVVTIYDAHHTSDPDIFSTPLNIGIEARNAFGTGNHETTRLMVESILEQPLDGRRVLDCGCGTGILAITALRCGAKEAVAFDIDEWSAENTRHNAELNGVGDRIEVLCGDAHVLSHVEGIFDVILANINRNILLEDMPRYHDVLTRGGALILSGFYEEDAPLLLKKAEAMGLHEISRKTDNGWCSLAFQNYK